MLDTEEKKSQIYIGDKLREILRKRDISIQELSDMTGIANFMLSKVQNNKQAVGLKNQF